MAKKKSSKKKSKSSNSSASEAGPTQIELVTPATTTQAQMGRMGLGLVLSFPLGWGPLNDAFVGRGPYEVSMAKFLLVVAACVIGTTVVGNLLDKAPPAPSKSTPDAGDYSSNNPESPLTGVEAGLEE